jgi:inositol hexakisphosphate/diphosphoinositol-pentakisphosphate kinase
VILTYREKEITRRIVLVFKQFVCGFDILRVQQGHSVVSFVCDVNGWSFVKNSRKYYDDCAQILSEHILAAIKPEKLKSFSTLDPMITTSLNRLEFIAEEKKGGTFLSRATRMLHGDPVDDDDDDDDDHSDAAESHETGASEMVDGTIPERCIPDDMVSAPASMCQSTNSSVAFDERCENLSRSERSQSLDQESHEEELRCVLAIIRHGDRTPKQKLKLNMSEPHILQYFHNHSKDCKKDLKVKAKGPLTEFLQTVKTTLRELERTPATENLRYELLHMRDVLERWKIAGLNRKLQIKPRKFEVYVDENGENKERCAEVQLILKWGGNLTRLGEKQSISLGRRFRHEMYPDASGGGILRLHSTFRHDLKIKTSDEGRVMKTAAAFAKGLLELEGDLPPILVSLVHKEKDSMHMLDPSGNKEVKMELDECKEKITSHLQLDIDVGRASEEELEQLVGPKEIDSIRSALSSLGNPRKALKRIHDLIKELIYRLEEMLSNLGSGDEAESKAESSEEFALSGVKLYKGETLLELTERWKFIFNRLYDEDEDTFDLSRIPDVHDNVRFDMLHNPHLGLTDILGQLYELAKNFADCVVPQEYGTTISEKRSVGLKICRGLLEKIKFDLGVARTDNKVDMRYMISKSVFSF